VPFRDVYIHALVRDANREKMSKMKGNVIDPIEIVKKFGTDAVRFTLASMASPGTDIAFNEARTEGYRAFANKIWNAARFIFLNVDKAAEVGIVVDPAVLGGMPSVPDDAPIEARWIIHRLNDVCLLVNRALEDYRFDEAASYIYQFFWANFCDVYLEFAKIDLDFSESYDEEKARLALTTLLGVFEGSLRLLAPFMPFLTEEIWQTIYGGNAPGKSIALAKFPYPSGGQEDILRRQIADEIYVRMLYVLELINDLRNQRKEKGVPEKELVPGICSFAIPLAREAFNESLRAIKKQARISDLAYTDAALRTTGLERQFPAFDVEIVFEHKRDIPAERERLTKDIARLEKNLASAGRQLGNDAFLSKAPPAVVEGLKKQHAENLELLTKAKAALDALPKDPQ